jgi:hypothetical protein
MHGRPGPSPAHGPHVLPQVAHVITEWRRPRSGGSRRAHALSASTQTSPRAAAGALAAGGVADGRGQVCCARRAGVGTAAARQRPTHSCQAMASRSRASHSACGAREWTAFAAAECHVSQGCGLRAMKHDLGTLRSHGRRPHDRCGTRLQRLRRVALLASCQLKAAAMQASERRQQRRGADCRRSGSGPWLAGLQDGAAAALATCHLQPSTIRDTIRDGGGWRRITICHWQHAGSMLGRKSLERFCTAVVVTTVSLCCQAAACASRPSGGPAACTPTAGAAALRPAASRAAAGWARRQGGRAARRAEGRQRSAAPSLRRQQDNNPDSDGFSSAGVSARAARHRQT